MSLSWRKQLGVAICGDCVGVVVFARGWRRAPAQAVVLEVPSSGQPGFLAALAVFDEWLSREGYRGAALQLTLSDEFVRYALMPASLQLSGNVEREALARACLETLHGSHIAACEIGYDDVAADKTALACAIEREHLQAVRELCKVHGLQLQSLQPGFVRAVNRWRRQMPATGMLLMPAEASMVGAVVDVQGWASVWQQPVGVALDAVNMDTMIRRESLLRGLSGDEVVVVLRDGLAETDLSLANAILLPPAVDPGMRYPLGLASLAFA